MVDEVLVAERHPRIEDGRELIAGLIRAGLDVSVAFWVLTSEFRRWYLYVASPQVMSGNPSSFQIVYDFFKSSPHLNSIRDQIRKIPSTDPNALEAAALRDRRWGGLRPITLFGNLGDLSVDYVYIYERISASLRRDEVIQKVVGLIERTGPQEPSKLTLRDGSVLQGIPVALESSQRGVAVSIEDATTRTKHSVLADAVANIE